MCGLSGGAENANGWNEAHYVPLIRIPPARWGHHRARCRPAEAVPQAGSAVCMQLEMPECRRGSECQHSAVCGWLNRMNQNHSFQVSLGIEERQIASHACCTCKRSVTQAQGFFVTTRPMAGGSGPARGAAVSMTSVNEVSCSRGGEHTRRSEVLRQASHRIFNCATVAFDQLLVVVNCARVTVFRVRSRFAKIALAYTCSLCVNA